MAVQITSQKELRNWLEGKPVEWAQSIATRAALRVFPVVLSDQGNRASGKAFERSQGLTLQVFRANFISWAACKYPAHDMKSAASAAASAASASAAALSAVASFASASASASASAAAAPFASASASAAALSASASASASAASAIWRSVATDCEWLEAHGDSGGLVDLPLWHPGNASNIPDWMKEVLDHFALHPEVGQKTEWRLILDWYRALLPWRPGASPLSAFGSNADIEIALQPDAFWTISEERSAEQILREIGEIAGVDIHGSQKDEGEEGNSGDLAELEADIQTALENIEPQVPAAYRFEIRDGKIAALPQADVATDPRGAQTMLDEARRKAEFLKERLDRSNAAQRVKTSINGLLDALPEQISDLDEYRLRSRFRSVEADARAYVNDEAELVPDAVASLLDLSDTLKDLQSFYPALRNMEAEVLAFDIPSNRIDETLDSADEVAEVVEEFPELVDASTPDALKQFGAIPREEAAVDVRQKRTAEYLLVVRNFLSPIVRVALDSGFARAAGRLGSDIYDKARPKIVEGAADGLGSMAKPATILAIAGVVGFVLGPTAGMAAAAVGFGKIDLLLRIAEKLLKKLTDQPEPTDRAQEKNEHEPENGNDGDSSDVLET